MAQSVASLAMFSMRRCLPTTRAPRPAKRAVFAGKASLEINGNDVCLRTSASVKSHHKNVAILQKNIQFAVKIVDQRVMIAHQNAKKAVPEVASARKVL